ncbi:Os04g0684000 [Oryza sativa Japonica Group]|uniref:Os04g0684000 protein n=2 Tax=Oryza sativa subsp. japonica TaxID=39947 RepID=Q0J8W6_ORYSJ|nr:hypothetical protein EE612_026350 [Oryza sativa]BAF16221.1 Os04g0684000 [Oryza sativa Japonica Group]BAS91710.1 Os04g0684000 [Oryza sativa Japonica Group]|eukprot:NP_001054307.1 Os04g0684000 [Oryza sativa Japonica Group]
MSAPDTDPILGGALSICCWCCAAAAVDTFMVPSGPYLRGRPRFLLTGSMGVADGGTVGEPAPAEAETEAMLLCINGGGGGAASIWNCMPASGPGPMDWRIAVGLIPMLGMGRMTDGPPCIPASGDALCPPPPPPPPSIRCCC